MTNSCTILFMGTPQFAATALTGLMDAGFDIIGVITQPDAPRGRGGIITPGETKAVANKHKIPVFQPESKGELTEIVSKIQPELIVVAAYGMIVPQEVLDIPKYGALNIHGSLLPAYRGASPIVEAILNGDQKTGITIMKMTIGMDEGAIISQFKLPILSPLCHPYESEDILGQAKDDNEKYDTTATLTEKMAELGARAIVETIPRWVSGELKETPQDNDKATCCKKIVKEDGHIDWSKPAEHIERMVRAYTPWPTAYAFAGDLRVKIVKASWIPGLRPGMTSDIGVLHLENGHIYVGTGKGTLEITELQPEGKKPMSARDFINGNKQLDGVKLS